MSHDASRLMDVSVSVGPVRVRRPLMALCLVFMLGVFAGEWMSVGLVISAASAVCLFLSFFLRRNGWAHFFLYAALLLFGMLCGAGGRRDFSPCALENQISSSRTYLSLDGVIMDDPVFTPEEEGGSEGSCELRLRLHGLRQRIPWQQARGTVRVFVRGTSPGFFEFGQRWTMDGLLIRSNFESMRDGFTLYTDVDHSRRLFVGSHWNLSMYCFRARHRCAEILSRGIGESSQAALLIRALLLGYRSDLPVGLRDLFASTGTFHIFAISGLHVGIVAVLLIGLLKLLGLSREHWFFGLLPLLVLYTLGTGGRASAVRACVMALIFWAAPMVGRRADSLSALALAALGILVVDSSQLMQPGFVMSFVVVAGLILMVPTLSAFWRRVIQPDPLRLERETGPVALWRGAARWIGDLFCVSLAAWLASAPMTAYYFNLVSPVSLLGNVLVVPGTFLVVFTGCLSLLSGLIIPPAAELFNFANQAFLDLLLLVVRGMQQVPGGHYFVQSPPGWMLVGWYAGLAVLFFGTHFLRRLLWVVITVLICLGVWYHLTERTMSVDVLDVGHGYAALVNLPGERDDMLVDAGCTRSAMPIVRHLRRCGVDRLGVLVLSYPGYDVLAGAEQILLAIPVRELWCVNPSVFSMSLREERDVRLYESLIRQAREKGVFIRYLSRGDGGFLAGMQWDVFHPPDGGEPGSVRDAALVLRIAREGGGVLFMGGARRRTENEMLRGRSLFSAPVLVAGAHGAAGTCSRRFLERVSPDVAILSVGLYNVFGDQDVGVL
ncbi:MAG: ComEC/Rec2 family competence protein, partial [Kiritimatiellae bacterium]|nr:ComEC/Rec2 family competence protein [Kiritimatiellia bacterium]